jgi:preprotein translocase subunit Sec61beta
MKPFNLEQALKGKPVVTRIGRKVKHITIHSDGGLTAFVPLDGGLVSEWDYTDDGKFYDDGMMSDRDLFMAGRQITLHPRAILFSTAFVQVLLVSLNTILLAHKQIASSIAVAGLISYVWTFNVKRAAFGSHWDKIIYSLGAACGSGVGIYLAGLIL